MGYPHRYLMGKIQTVRAAGVIQRLFPFLAHARSSAFGELRMRDEDIRLNAPPSFAGLETLFL
jgi:hypothetical protein